MSSSICSRVSALESSCSLSDALCAGDSLFCESGTSDSVHLREVEKVVRSGFRH